MITIFEKAVDGTPDVPKLDLEGNQYDLYDYTYSGTHLGDHKITATIESPVKIDFNIGEKVLFRGHYYYIQTLPIAQRIYNSLMVSYTITFWSVEYELGIISFQDVVIEDPSEYQFSGNLEVILYSNVDYLMNKIIANTTRALTLPLGQEWNYKIYTEDNPDYDVEFIDYAVDLSVIKDIQVINGYCSDALSLVNSLFGLTYTIREKRTIYINYPPVEVLDENDVPFVFQFGFDLGVCEINRLANDQKIITRAIGYGSSRNIPENYRVGDDATIYEYHPRLMMPEFTAPYNYVEDAGLIATYGVREGIYPTNDNIYPSITGAYNKAVPPRPIDVIAEANTFNYYDSGYRTINHPAEWVPGVIPPERYVGELYGGGVVVWVDPTSKGRKGIIASLVDSPLTKWEQMSGGGVYATYANSVDDGRYNSDILLVHPKTNTFGAKYCEDLVEATFSDWYMPAINELVYLYWSRYDIGNMSGKTYWSSTEVTGSDDWKEAMCLSFSEGVAYDRHKGDNQYYVRPVRAFEEILDVPPVLKPAYTEDVKANPSTTVSFKVNDPEFGASGVFSESIYSGVPPKISFTTGDMQGIEFPIKTYVKDLNADGTWTSGHWIVTVDRDMSDPNHPLPNDDLNIALGDKFVYLDIYMPQKYVDEAEVRLEADVRAWLLLNAQSPHGYAIKITEEWIAINPASEVGLRESNAVNILDSFLDANDKILVQGISITYKHSDILPTYDLTISTTPITNKFSWLEKKQEEEAKEKAIQDSITNQKIRNAIKSTYDLQQTILMTNGDINGGKVGTSTLKSGSLTQEARSTNFILQAYMQVNYLGDVNSAHGSSGVLIHKDGDLIWGDVFDVAHNTWTIDNEASFTLDPDVLYWVYIKGSMVDGSAEWIVSADKLGFYEYDNYYMFEWGQIHPVVDDYRYIQTTNGLNGISSYVYIGYASDDIGTDFTLTADPLLDWMAILTTPSQLLPPVASDFAGLWYDRSGKATLANGLISGGLVTWIEGYTYAVSAAVYRITGVIYNSPSMEVTLDPSDNTDSRIDVIYVDTDSLAGNITGSPAVDPVKPQVDNATQIELTSILLLANSTEPSDISDDIIYDENVEWATSVSGVTVDFDNATSPFRGSKCASVGAIGNNDTITFTSASVLNFDDYGTLILNMKLKASCASAHTMYVQFLLAGVTQSSAVLVIFNHTDITNWQSIVLDLSDFVRYGATFDGLKLRWSKTGSNTNYTGFYLDYVKLQTGMSQPAFVDTIDLIGDVTGHGHTGSPIPTILATVNSNVGTYGSSTKTITATVDAKGRITAISESNLASPLTFNDTTDVDLVNTANVITANTIGYTGTFKDADGIIFDVLNGLIKSPSGQITINKIVTQDAEVIDDNTEFSVTVTGQRVGSPYIETLPLSQDSPAIFEGVPYDDYVITEDALAGYTLTSIIDDTITLSVGDKEKTVEVINDKDAGMFYFVTVGDDGTNEFNGKIVMPASIPTALIVDWGDGSAYEEIYNATPGLGGYPYNLSHNYTGTTCDIKLSVPITDCIRIDVYSTNASTPPNLAGLTSLQYLSIGNTLITVPPDVTDCIGLQTLSISNTDITTPPDLTGLTSLVNLSLSNTLITVPPDVTDCIALLYLSLDNCSSLINPPVLAGLVDLVYLGLDNSPITTPPDLTGLVSLQYFTMPNTSISVSPDVTDCVAIVNIDLGNCSLLDTADVDALLGYFSTLFADCTYVSLINTAVPTPAILLTAQTANPQCYFDTDV